MTIKIPKDPAGELPGGLAKRPPPRTYDGPMHPAKLPPPTPPPVDNGG